MVVDRGAEVAGLVLAGAAHVDHSSGGDERRALGGGEERRAQHVRPLALVPVGVDAPLRGQVTEVAGHLLAQRLPFGAARHELAVRIAGRGAVVVAGHVEVARILAKAGADLSLRGTGAPGFAGKTAYDLAVERGMVELATELKPKSED